ncbi:MAG: hypothetical protein ACE5KK_00755 [Candidatus Brocadiales bacterium]
MPLLCAVKYHSDRAPLVDAPNYSVAARFIEPIRPHKWGSYKQLGTAGLVALRYRQVEKTCPTPY